MRHVVIGCGGIGGWLIRGLVPSLSPADELVLVDGDTYEPRNLRRQGATAGSKAGAFEQVAQPYRVPTRVVRAYVTKVTGQNAIAIDQLIREGDTVWVCPDNHATRKLVLDFASNLADITVLLAGNDGLDGNILVYQRVGGKELTPHPYLRHPELKVRRAFKPPTPAEHQMSCQVQADQGDTQTVLANFQAAACLLMAHRALTEGQRISELYFDCAAMGLRKVEAPA